mmetsp:Transcript_767/g.2023  ORF Transcript_767/g.2023 Transcript_767/m.2023 type:complete len:667 (+) Transcript_767:331-2331(+)
MAWSTAHLAVHGPRWLVCHPPSHDAMRLGACWGSRGRIPARLQSVGALPSSVKPAQCTGSSQLPSARLAASKVARRSEAARDDASAESACRYHAVRRRLADSSGTAHIDERTQRAPAAMNARGRPSTPSSHRSPPPECEPLSTTVGCDCSHVRCTWSLCTSPSSSSSPPSSVAVGVRARHLGWACTAQCTSAGGRSTSSSSTARAFASAPMSSFGSNEPAARSCSATELASSSACGRALRPREPSGCALPTTSAPLAPSAPRARLRRQSNAATEGATHSAVEPISAAPGAPSAPSAPKGTRPSTPVGMKTSSLAPASRASSGAISAACSAPSISRAVVAAVAASAAAASAASLSGGEPRHSMFDACAPMASCRRETACTTLEQPAAESAADISSLRKPISAAGSGETTHASASLSPVSVSITSVACASAATALIAAASSCASTGITFDSIPACSSCPTSRWSFPPRASSSRVASACDSSASASASFSRPSATSAICRSTYASRRASKNSAVSRLSALRADADTRVSQCCARRRPAHSRHASTDLARCTSAAAASSLCLRKVTPSCAVCSPIATMSECARASSTAFSSDAIASSTRPSARRTRARSARARVSVAGSLSSCASATVFSKYDTASSSRSRRLAAIARLPYVRISRSRSPSAIAILRACS